MPPATFFRTSALILLGLAIASAPAAQTETVTRPVVPRVEELKRDVQQAAPPANDAGAQALPAVPVPRELGKPGDDLQISVSGFRVSGLTEAPPAALERLLYRFAGPERSYEDLANAAAAATEYVQSELGYYLGYAYLPEQRIRDGIVEIAVLEGRLDEVILNWNPASLIRRSVLENALSTLRPGDILRVADVERTVFVINDLVGGSARFEVRAGRQPGTASLVVTPEPDARWAAQATLDNLGSRYSGEYRAGVGVSVPSPLGLGDGLSLNAMVSHTGGLAFALANYTLPLGRSGLKLGMSVSHMAYALDEAEFPLGLEGTTTAYSLFGLYPIVRGRNLNLFAQIGADYKDFVDKQTALSIENSKHTRIVWTGLVGDFRDRVAGGGITSFSALVGQGEVSLDNAFLAADNDARFTKLGLSLSRLQALIPNRWLLFARYSGQIAFANLDSTERYSLGGESGVRAYAPGEGAGDSAHVGTLELRFLPPARWFDLARELSFSAFGDWGYAKPRHDASAQPASFDNAIHLAGAGVGLTWERPRRASARAAVAWRLTDPGVSDSEDRVPRIYFVATYAF